MVDGPNNAPADETVQLRECAKAAFTRLLELGLGGERASDGSTVYFNALSKLFTDARISRAMSGVNVTQIHEPKGTDVRSEVRSHGLSGAVWIEASDPVKIVVEYISVDNTLTKWETAI